KAKQLGFPIALKLVAPEIVHKTESGAVVLGLKSASEVEAAGKDLLAKASQAHLLLQEMIQGTEVLVGARSDPQYGPFLMVGLGGIFVEVLKDVALRLLPVSEAEAVEMLKELRGYKILTGVRGQPPRDLKALARAMAGVSELFAVQREHLSDFEINPLMVRPEGQGAVAVDVRLVRK
ncbi:MAG TPA: acetate--CoA ligase family protein, partial [Candidatus Binatia bacterium]|nr:acetate--CoA ligase family protein [Candidatus Binatia bacterium]